MNKGLEKPCLLEVCYYPTKAEWKTEHSAVYKETGSKVPFLCAPRYISLRICRLLYTDHLHLQVIHLQQLGLRETKDFRNTDVALREKGDIN